MKRMFLVPAQEIKAEIRQMIFFYFCIEPDAYDYTDSN